MLCNLSARLPQVFPDESTPSLQTIKVTSLRRGVNSRLAVRQTQSGHKVQWVNVSGNLIEIKSTADLELLIKVALRTSRPS